MGLPSSIKINIPITIKKGNININRINAIILLNINNQDAELK